MGASSCRLALVRAHYILGEVEEADALMKAASGKMFFFSFSMQKKIEVMQVRPLVEVMDARRVLVGEARKVVKEFGHLPYKFGGADPKSGGFDCSGAMSYVLKRCGYNPPRTSAQQFVWVRDDAKIHLVGKKVESLDDPSFKHLRVGDLLFWSGTYTPTDGRKVNISHVGVYLGKEADGRPVMACASVGRSYRGKKGDGYGIYDFKLPSKGSKSIFVGYGSVPGMP